ncbi:hypothetical protein EYF80_047073 [Liparis tanakae]|uniref:Uncharacterized protein n=1 Tax=Liparis tanakae TaxID=230148 RepID=A0A4Z2FNC6_9TELE|nr:hypothetical protein EYF80_047073 [Liparis tanakae]
MLVLLSGGGREAVLSCDTAQQPLRSDRCLAVKRCITWKWPSSRRREAVIRSAVPPRGSAGRVRRPRLLPPASCLLPPASCLLPPLGSVCVLAVITAAFLVGLRKYWFPCLYILRVEFSLSEI